MWIFDLGRIRQSSPTMRGGKRSKEEEEGPLLHAPLPPEGVLRCLRSSGLTFSFSQFRVRMCSLTSIYFSKNFRKNISDFFREFILFGNPFLTIAFCLSSFFGAVLALLLRGFIVLRACVHLRRPLRPVPAHRLSPLGRSFMWLLVTPRGGGLPGR